MWERSLEVKERPPDQGNFGLIDWAGNSAKCADLDGRLGPGDGEVMMSAELLSRALNLLA